MNKIKFNPTKSHQVYQTESGERVPGVTTVLSATIPKPALLAWAWQCGVDGTDYRRVKDKAADIGTIAHWLIELHLREQEPDTSEFAPADLSKAENAVIKFLSWWDAGHYEFLASELQLVSETERYGGTLDIISRQNGELVLIDLKTGRGIYDEMRLQLAAYANLFDENSKEKLKRYIICRIGKEEQGDFEVREWQDLSTELEVFRDCLSLNKSLKKLKGRG